MDTTNRTILSFEEFIKQGETQDQMGQTNQELPIGTETEPVQDEIPLTGEEPSADLLTGDEISTGMQADADSHSMPVHMMDDETGEATAEAPAVDANVMLDNEPKKD